jgi:hypothetical protein
MTRRLAKRIGKLILRCWVLGVGTQLLEGLTARRLEGTSSPSSRQAFKHQAFITQHLRCGSALFTKKITENKVKKYLNKNKIKKQKVLPSAYCYY